MKVIVVDWVDDWQNEHRFSLLVPENANYDEIKRLAKQTILRQATTKCESFSLEFYNENS